MRRFFFVLILYPVIFYNAAITLAAPPGHAGETAPQPEYIAVIWSDGDILKAVNLMAINPESGGVGILAVPTYTIANPQRDWTTLSDLYARKGTAGVLGGLSSATGLPTKKYLLIPQRGLEKMSLQVGSVNVMGRNTTLLNVFEGTYVDGPVDLQIEIRSLAKGVISPSVLARLPELIYLAASEFRTNANFVDLIGIYRCVLVGGPEIIKKSKLPGNYHYIGEKKVWHTDPLECKTAMFILSR